MQRQSIMISLARHIEILLLEHDCVIVPGFGGFLTNYVEAQIPNDAQATLVPPYRSIGFNQSLQSNDGLLVQSYMQAYDAAYPEASKQMRMDIDEMDSELKINGSYMLDNIGKLFIDLNHRITFKASAVQLTTPLLYSLPQLPMISAEQAEKEAELQKALKQTTIIPLVPADQPKTEADTEDENKDGNMVISFPRRWVDIAISAAAAVVLFFALSYSSLHENDSNETVVVSAASIKAPSGQTTKVNATEGKAMNWQTANEGQNVVGEATNRNTGKAQSNGKPFTIVLASGVKQRNAEDYIEWMKRNDFKEARFVNDGKMNRVVYGAYANEDSAREALKQLRELSSEFHSSWVIELTESND